MFLPRVGSTLLVCQHELLRELKSLLPNHGHHIQRNLCVLVTTLRVDCRHPALGCYARSGGPCNPQAAWTSSSLASELQSIRSFNSGALSAARQARGKPALKVWDELPQNGAAPRTTSREQPGNEATDSSASHNKSSNAQDFASTSDTKSGRISVFDNDPMIEKYMRLRASGKHVSQDEELFIAEHLMARAAVLETPGKKSSHAFSQQTLPDQVAGCITNFMPSLLPD